MRDIRRGEIWYINGSKNYMENNGTARPAIVVSNDTMNSTSDRAMIVYLTTQDKGNSFHIPVEVKGTRSFAITENINTVYHDRFNNFAGFVPVETMKEIEKCIVEALALGGGACEGEEPQRKQEVPETKKEPQLLCIGCTEKSNYKNMEQRALKAEREVSIYKDMYDSLLEKVIN